MKINEFTAALASSVCIVAIAAPAQAQERKFNIPAGTLKSALDAYARQSGRPVIYKADDVRRARSNGARGSLSEEAALDAVLSGTGFSARVDTSGAVAIVGSSSHKAGSEGEAVAGGAAADNESADIVVTGSHIRGGSSASRTITIGQQQIKEEGFADLGEVIRSIPQNFRGGQNPGVARGATVGNAANYDGTGGSALNLRGLGADATLTLLNGHRLSSEGGVQAVDISAIPIEAIDRMEIVPDGASAIYGSDAVGGVGNVVLKRDFDGLTVGTRQGGATDGGLATHEYFATAGATWDTGGFITALQNSSRSPIYADQRNYTKSMYDPTTIYNGSDLYSILVSAHQSLSDSIDFRIDGMHTDRSAESYTGLSSSYY